MIFSPFGGFLSLSRLGSPVISMLAIIFWVWVLIDCVVKEPADGNDKVAWVLIILFVPLVGALLYYFLRRPERMKAVGR